MTRLAYTIIALVIWGLAAWIFLDVQQDLLDRRFVDDFTVTYNETEGR